MSEETNEETAGDERLSHPSRRDYFAGCALTALIVLRGNSERMLRDLAAEAWHIAEIMLEGK